MWWNDSIRPFGLKQSPVLSIGTGMNLFVIWWVNRLSYCFSYLDKQLLRFKTRLRYHVMICVSYTKSCFLRRTFLLFITHLVTIVVCITENVIQSSAWLFPQLRLVRISKKKKKINCEKHNKHLKRHTVWVWRRSTGGDMLLWVLWWWFWYWE